MSRATSSRPYRPARGSARVARTRARIMEAVRELLAEGRFHEATVAEVAARAGVSRATLYQHFGTRVGLVDAICETLADNPALVALRGAPEQESGAAIIGYFLRETVRFWASEEAIHRHLYGLAVIDPAAADFVARQGRDRRREVERVVAALEERGALDPALGPDEAGTLLMLLSSFGAYDELRASGLGEAAVVAALASVARRQLLSDPAAERRGR
ncbi:MAG: TetR/AcrR family transcriptional regulator [Syntrophothermus sp.]